MPKRKVRCVVACSNANGSHDFFGCTVSVTLAGYNEGAHYELAKDRARDKGYDGDMVVFDEDEGPEWLFSLVDLTLGERPEVDRTPLAWNDTTMLNLLDRFVDENGLRDALECFLDRVAAEEIEQTKET